MPALCDGRVVAVTGGGRGLGRAYALALADQGAAVVINDIDDSADDVVREIVQSGGRAVANHSDITDWNDAAGIVDQAVSGFGRLDVVINNAGILRDKMIFSMDEESWDDVIRVHLRATAAVSRWATAHWRERSKAGESLDARLINTTSGSGLYGGPSQTNYAAAKAGVAGFTVTAAMEMGRYGVTVNAVAPAARTQLTEHLIANDGFPPERVVPVVVWLASAESKGVTGRVFDVGGDWLAVAEGWRKGAIAENPGGWTIDAVGAELPRLIADSAPNPDQYGYMR